MKSDRDKVSAASTHTKRTLRTSRTKPSIPFETTQLRANDSAGAATMPPLRREMLLDALERLLKETGFLHLQTSEIAARLHCSKQTLYFLAPSRMQLFELVAQRLFDRICRETDTAAAQAKDWRGAAISHLDGAVFATRGVGPQFLYDLYAFPAVVESYRKRRVDGFAAIIRE